MRWGSFMLMHYRLCHRRLGSTVLTDHYRQAAGVADVQVWTKQWLYKSHVVQINILKTNLLEQQEQY